MTRHNFFLCVVVLFSGHFQERSSCYSACGSSQWVSLFKISVFFRHLHFTVAVTNEKFSNQNWPEQNAFRKKRLFWPPPPPTSFSVVFLCPLCLSSSNSMANIFFGGGRGSKFCVKSWDLYYNRHDQLPKSSEANVTKNYVHN